MRTLLLVSILAAGGAFTPLRAQFGTFTFTLDPAADLFGKPGDLVGWGYQVTNQDPFDWLTIDSVNTTTNFTLGTADAVNFTPLLIGPGATQESLFYPGTAGLYELLINPGAVYPSPSDVGTFEVSGTWYYFEPGSGDCPDFSCVDTVLPSQYTDQAAFSLTVVPEPATFWFVAMALCVFTAGWPRRRRRPADSATTAPRTGS